MLATLVPANLARGLRAHPNEAREPKVEGARGGQGGFSCKWMLFVKRQKNSFSSPNDSELGAS